jgi:hypothetical protein
VWFFDQLADAVEVDLFTPFQLHDRVPPSHRACYEKVKDDPYELNALLLFYFATVEVRYCVLIFYLCSLTFRKDITLSALYKRIEWFELVSMAKCKGTSRSILTSSLLGQSVAAVLQRHPCPEPLPHPDERTLARLESVCLTSHAMLTDRPAWTCIRTITPLCPFLSPLLGIWKIFNWFLQMKYVLWVNPSVLDSLLDCTRAFAWCTVHCATPRILGEFWTIYKSSISRVGGVGQYVCHWWLHGRLSDCMLLFLLVVSSVT